MPENPDETHLRLLRAIAAQDRAALADFYDLAGGVLFATALKMLGDTHEAEEVVQDVFVQIWTKAATFDAALGAPFHWALGITRNRCIDRIRARQRRTRLFDDMEEETKAAVATDHGAAAGLSAGSTASGSMSSTRSSRTSSSSPTRAVWSVAVRTIARSTSTTRTAPSSQAS